MLVFVFFFYAWLFQPGIFVSFSWQLPGFTFVGMSKNKEIKRWLNGEQEYEEGVGLYRKYGADEFLKAMFEKGETRFNRKALLEELELLLGSQKADLASAEEEAVVFSTLKFPIGQYPKALQQLMQQAGNLYKQAKRLHTELRLNKRMLNGVEAHLWPYLSADERKHNALNILKLFEQNRKCWQELRYFEEHGRLLSPDKPAKFSLPEGNTDLKLEIFRLRPLVCKWRKRMEKAADPVRKNHCEGKLAAYENLLAEAERRLHGAV